MGLQVGPEWAGRDSNPRLTDYESHPLVRERTDGCVFMRSGGVFRLLVRAGSGRFGYVRLRCVCSTVERGAAYVPVAF